MNSKGKRPSRKRRSPEEARANILKAAEIVMADLGPDAASLKEVAREAGVSHGLITHYFGTYESLVESVLERAAAATRQHMVSQLVSMKDQSLEAALGVFFDSMSAPQHGRLVAWSLLSGRSSASDFLAPEVAGPRRVADVIEQRLRQLHPKASVQRDEIDRLVAMVLVMGLSMSFGRGAVWQALGRSDSPEERERFRTWLADLVRGRVRDQMGITAESGDGS